MFSLPKYKKLLKGKTNQVEIIVFFKKNYNKDLIKQNILDVQVKKGLQEKIKNQFLIKSDKYLAELIAKFYLTNLIYIAINNYKHFFASNDNKIIQLIIDDEVDGAIMDPKSSSICNINVSIDFGSLMAIVANRFNESLDKLDELLDIIFYIEDVQQLSDLSSKTIGTPMYFLFIHELTHFWHQEKIIVDRTRVLEFYPIVISKIYEEGLAQFSQFAASKYKGIDLNILKFINEKLELITKSNIDNKKMALILIGGDLAFPSGPLYIAGLSIFNLFLLNSLINNKKEVKFYAVEIHHADFPQLKHAEYENYFRWRRAFLYSDELPEIAKEIGISSLKEYLCNDNYMIIYKAPEFWKEILYIRSILRGADYKKFMDFYNKICNKFDLKIRKMKELED